MNQELFRREVIDASRDRLAGTVVAAVPPSSRLYTGLLLGLFVVLLLILIFGSYASRAVVRGIVAYVPHPGLFPPRRRRSQHVPIPVRQAADGPARRSPLASAQCGVASPTSSASSPARSPS